MPQSEAEEDTSITPENTAVADSQPSDVTTMDKPLQTTDTTPESANRTIETQPPPVPSTSTLPANDLDLSPESMKLTRRELDFVEKLSPLVQTPRSAKRLINIYRLIRASVKSHEFDHFLGKDGSGGEYQSVLLLLASQIGFPLAANRLFAQILGAADTIPLSMIAEFRPSATVESKAPAEPTGWTRLCEILTESKVVPDRDAKDFKKWVPRVSRFSFRGIG